MNGKRLYLYLTGRDKKGVKVLMTLQGLDTPPTRVANIADLRLQPELYEELDKFIESHKIGWEMWIESANSYQDLSDSLLKRGHSEVPIKCNPLHSESNFSDPHIADTRLLPKRKTMIRKST